MEEYERNVLIQERKELREERDELKRKVEALTPGAIEYQDAVADERDELKHRLESLEEPPMSLRNWILSSILGIMLLSLPVMGVIHWAFFPTPPTPPKRDPQHTAEMALYMVMEIRELETSAQSDYELAQEFRSRLGSREQWKAQGRQECKDFHAHEPKVIGRCSELSNRMIDEAWENLDWANQPGI